MRRPHLIGASSYLWRRKHDVQHHTHANVDDLLDLVRGRIGTVPFSAPGPGPGGAARREGGVRRMVHA
jgi:hypothetical protein